MVPQSTMLPIIPSICLKRLTGLVMGNETAAALLHGVWLYEVDYKVFKEDIKSYKVGTKSYRVGTKSYGVGTKSYGVGTKSYRVGTKSYGVGTKPYKVGTKPYKVGTKSYGVGNKSYRVGNKSYRVGTFSFIEIVCDVSFLKVLQLLVDGDIESNPGPTDNVENTPAKGKGRPKGTPKKGKGFRGTPRKIMNALSNVDTDMNAPVNISNVNSNQNAPTGMLNISNDCFLGLAQRVLMNPAPSVRQSVRLSVTKVLILPVLILPDFLHQISLKLP